MKRKTVEVEKVRSLANCFLAGSADKQADAREGVAGLLECVLHDTGNYRGFHYLEADHSTIPPTLGDETRRYYH